MGKHKHHLSALLNSSVDVDGAMFLTSYALEIIDNSPAEVWPLIAKRETETPTQRLSKQGIKGTRAGLEPTVPTLICWKVPQ